MPRRLIALFAAFAFLAAGLAPGLAHARDGDRYWRGGDRHYSDRHHHRRHHRDNDDAVVAGVVGLALGLAVGSMLSQPRREVRCADNYQRCAPPLGYQDQRYYEDEYYEQSYDDEGRYAPPPQDYAAPRYASDACIRPVEQFDPHSGRYVWVNLRVPC